MHPHASLQPRQGVFSGRDPRRTVPRISVQSEMARAELAAWCKGAGLSFLLYTEKKSRSAAAAAAAALPELCCNIHCYISTKTGTVPSSRVCVGTACSCAGLDMEDLVLCQKLNRACLSGQVAKHLELCCQCLD